MLFSKAQYNYTALQNLDHVSVLQRISEIEVDRFDMSAVYLTCHLAIETPKIAYMFVVSKMTTKIYSTQ